MIDTVVIIFGKLIYKTLRLFGSHGAALPGLIVERLRPSLLHKLTTLPEGIIVVSGTNGKTTTTHLVSELLRRQNKVVFTNHSGSNMTRGLLSSIVRFATVSGKLSYDVAVLEIDEAYAAKLAPTLRPRAVVLTNVLRDQLDRFGEIDTTAKLLHTLAAKTTEVVCFNICDPRLENVARHLTKQVKAVSFGYTKQLSSQFPSDDSWYGIHSGTAPSATYMLDADNGSPAIIGPDKTIRPDTGSMTGWHNFLNLTAAVSVVDTMFAVEQSDVIGLEPPYGRGEQVYYKDCLLTLQLVKNPAGFFAAMNVNQDDPALIVINDNIADSRDVSWLWDVDVNQLRHRPALYISGIRAYDMANRLQYADISTTSVDINLQSALERFIEGRPRGTVFLTYTAMLEVRKLVRSGR